MPHLHQQYQEGSKNYASDEFRGAFPKDVSFVGSVRRHKYDCELAKAAAEYMPGPRMCEDTLSGYRSTISSGDNVHYFGTKSANDRDKAAVVKVLQAAHNGYDADKHQLTALEASHIRAGALWLAEHKDEFSDGFIASNLKIYENAVGPGGFSVVDRTWFGPTLEGGNDSLTNSHSRGEAPQTGGSSATSLALETPPTGRDAANAPAPQRQEFGSREGAPPRAPLPAGAPPAPQGSTLEAPLASSPSKGKGGQRPFDAGKDEYRAEHPGLSGRQTRHIIANSLLERYNADPNEYALHAKDINYRMGGRRLNLSKDKLVDNGLIREIFKEGTGSYNAEYIAKKGVSYQQQGDLLALRFDRLGEFYAKTHNPLYRQMMEDVRSVAKNNLSVDLREWKLPKDRGIPLPSAAQLGERSAPSMFAPRPAPTPLPQRAPVEAQHQAGLLSYNAFRSANAGMGLTRNGTGPGSMSFAYKNQGQASSIPIAAPRLRPTLAPQTAPVVPRVSQAPPMAAPRHIYAYASPSYSTPSYVPRSAPTYYAPPAPVYRPVYTPSFSSGYGGGGGWGGGGGLGYTSRGHELFMGSRGGVYHMTSGGHRRYH